MLDIYQILIVAALSPIGGVCRFVANLYWTASPFGITMSTLVINCIACFLIGILYELKIRGSISDVAYFLVSAGYLGALSTFSGYAINIAASLLNGNDTIAAILYAIFMPWLGVAFSTLGISVTKGVLS